MKITANRLHLTRGTSAPVSVFLRLFAVFTRHTPVISLSSFRN